MKTPHEQHEEKRKQEYDKMKARCPDREFITVLPPGAKKPYFVFTDGKHA